MKSGRSSGSAERTTAIRMFFSWELILSLWSSISFLSG